MQTNAATLIADPGKAAALAFMRRVERELVRRHGADWRAPQGSTPCAVADAWTEDAGRVAEAAAAVSAQRRTQMIAWHAAELARLEAAT